MKPLKIVIVSENCYPFLSPRSHRATQLAIELAKRGHDMTLYSLLGDYDYSQLQNETGIKFKTLGRSRFGLQDNVQYRNKNIFYRGVAKFFGKFFAFPHIEISYLVKKCLEREQNIDVLITLAHPHAIHWAIPYLKRKNFKCWIADCGDPFMGNPFNTYPFYFKYIEKKWCKLADYITVPIEEAKGGYFNEFRDKIRVIPQGFNFDEVKLAEYKENKIPTFAYSGVIYKGKRDPQKFIEYLSTLDLDFKFVVFTKNSNYFNQYKQLLGDKLEIRNYVPREELLIELSKMDFLINIKNNTLIQQPSKLIDYYLSKRPILEISTDFKEHENCSMFLRRNYKYQLEVKGVEKYNIKNVAKQFLDLI